MSHLTLCSLRWAILFADNSGHIVFEFLQFGCYLIVFEQIAFALLAFYGDKLLLPHITQCLTTGTFAFQILDISKLPCDTDTVFLCSEATLYITDNTITVQRTLSPAAGKNLER